MKRKIKEILTFIVLMIASINVYADSGFDAKYDSSSPMDLLGGLSSGLSFIIQLLISQPKDEDYMVFYLITNSICIILFYIFTNIYLFKLNKKQKNKMILLGISLIPTLIYASFCLLTKFILFVYVLLLVIYIFTLKITTNIILKKRLNKKLEQVKEIDKNFNIDEVNEKTFEVYKEVQIAWMNFELDNVKDKISKEIYEDYQTKLEKLTKDNHKNIMDKIEFKSNELTDIDIENNIETIECKMTITCLDYVINKDEKVIKGKNDKFQTYIYQLIFHRIINTDKYILIGKKILKQKSK